MFIDTQNLFSDNQAVTSTALSTNLIDTNPIGGPNATADQGIGEPIYLVVQTTQACTDSGSDATLTVTLESASDSGISSSPVVHFSTGALAFSAFSPAGARVAAVRLPNAQYGRYLGVRYTVASGPLTAGAFSAFLTHEVNSKAAYASGFSVS